MWPRCKTPLRGKVSRSKSIPPWYDVRAVKLKGINPRLEKCLAALDAGKGSLAERVQRLKEANDKLEGVTKKP